MTQLSLHQIPHTHIAIMRRSWGLTQKLLSGEKTIESRWYMNRYIPWNRISPNDIIYFKDSGQPITLKAQVKKVLQFADLTPQKVRHILSKYAKADGLGTQPTKWQPYLKRFRNKKYCLLIFLKNVKQITPFLINKTGFGAMASWLIVADINLIKK